MMWSDFHFILKERKKTKKKKKNEAKTKSLWFSVFTLFSLFLLLSGSKYIYGVWGWDVEFSVHRIQIYLMEIKYVYIVITQHTAYRIFIYSLQWNKIWNMERWKRCKEPYMINNRIIWTWPNDCINQIKFWQSVNNA